MALRAVSTLGGTGGNIVTTVTGTANQVTVTPNTGDVIVSLPSNVIISGEMDAGSFNATGTSIPPNGLYSNAANTLAFSSGGLLRFTLAGGGLSAANGSGANIMVAAASATLPTLVPNRSSTSTGIGAAASGNISMIVAGAEQMRFIGAGGVEFIKGTDPVTAPGAGFAKLYFVAGTLGGTAKLIAYAGTSTTPTTIIDNIGGGF